MRIQYYYSNFEQMLHNLRAWISTIPVTGLRAISNGHFPSDIPSVDYDEAITLMI